jgi:hypothetical protein
MADVSGLLGNANLAAEIADRHADSASPADYTRKNDHPPRKRQGAELAFRPSPIRLISESFYLTRFLDANRAALRLKTLC